MRILVVTDAWHPQVNGVVRTLTAMRDELRRMGDDVQMLTPEGFTTIPCPTYPEIPLALVGARTVARVVERFLPCAIHIATEGPLGLAARRFCLSRGLPFTTAVHTRFPEYIEARFRVPAAWLYPLLRRFHRHSSVVMAPTPTVVRYISDRGFPNVKLWGRGVDTDLFRPGTPAQVRGRRPVMLSVGRVAVEKNIAAFLDLDVEGTKVVVGDGPMREELKARYPDVVFVGAKHGKELVAYYNAADVFVFPSRTDTFGLVMLEALACGAPVAAFPVIGPLDVITEPTVGCLDEDLAVAIRAALTRDRAACRSFAEERSWNASAKTFRSYLHAFDPDLIGVDGTSDEATNDAPEQCAPTRPVS